MVLLIVCTACGNHVPKAYSETRTGRIKRKYYNAVEFNDRDGKAKQQKKYNKVVYKKKK